MMRDDVQVGQTKLGVRISQLCALFPPLDRLLDFLLRALAFKVHRPNIESSLGCLRRQNIPVCNGSVVV